MADETLIGDYVEMPRGEGAGGHIGPFKILQQIGEGGFGSVFEAEQEHPVKRRVALKIIKLGMDTREVIVRFEAERQALAMMDHPNIARVLDAGATDSGRPYFVMELVDGEPITAYCSRNRLTLPQRLQLFDQVCAAVQHAHTKGVIHRDLKPNNVLVSTQDDQPLAKVIDFGIAKATSGRLTEKTMYTEVNLMMGTPLYMSPEQAEGSADIDTRTDIYSLGVILYELLTDTTPLDSDTLRFASRVQMQRMIREVEPLRPSARLAKPITTKLGAEANSLGEPRKLARILRGELDWIVMKAIEKDRARRYETANALASDLRRYLDGEPVLAAPPNVIYRLQKFARRHKGTVAAGLLIAASLLFGIVGFASQARIAQQQARIAQQQTQLAQRQTQLAQQRANDLDQVANFEAAMLGQVDPTQAGKLLSDDVQAKFAEALAKSGVPEGERGAQGVAFAGLWQRINATDAARDLIDSTIMKPAVVAIEKQFRHQPLVDAYLRQTLADRYTGMALYEAAMPLQQSALATRKRLLGDDNPFTLASMLKMSALLDDQGRSAEAAPYARDPVARMRRLFGENDPKTLQALSLLALVLYDDGRLGEAESYYRQVLAIERRVLGEEHPNTLQVVEHIGLLLMYQHKLEEAEPFLREAAEKMPRVLGADDPTTLLTLCNYGYLLEHEARFDQAETVEREALRRARLALGENNPITLVATNLTAMVLEKKGEDAQAEQLLAPRDAAFSRTFNGSRAFIRVSYLIVLGRAHTGLGKYTTAQSELFEAQSMLQQTHNVTHADDVRDCTQALVALYTVWNKAEPGRGYDAKGAQWKSKLDALGGSNPERRALAA
jgi:serine/threonine protein kinase